VAAIIKYVLFFIVRSFNNVLLRNGARTTLFPLPLRGAVAGESDQVWNTDGDSRYGSGECQVRHGGGNTDTKRYLFFQRCHECKTVILHNILSTVHLFSDQISCDLMNEQGCCSSLELNSNWSENEDYN